MKKSSLTSLFKKCCGFAALDSNSKGSRRSAFSLVELSIVIIIIAILIAGITQSDRLVRMARLTAAKTLTQDTRASFSDSLILWVESTNDDSFNMDSSGNVTTWYDSDFTKNDVTAGATKPIYVDQNGIGVLPALTFVAGTTPMKFDGNPLAGKSFTMFVVEQSASPATGSTCFFGANPASNFSACIDNTGTLTVGAATGTVAGVSSSQVKGHIHTIVYNASTAAGSYISAAGVTTALTGLGTPPVFTAPTIGGNVTTGFAGNIGEVIIIGKVLKPADITTIQAYLKRKWKL